MKKIIMGLSIVCLTSCAKIFHSMMVDSGLHDQLTSSYSIAANKDIVELVKNISAYRQIKGEWPIKKENLQDVDLAIDSINNLDNFKNLTFKPYSDSLRVNYFIDYSKPVDEIKLIIGELTVLTSDNSINYKMDKPTRIEKVSR